jgi:lipopolysaccharide assembly outer membrane protein LptD (OstA)
MLYIINTGFFNIPAYRAAFRQNPLITRSKNGFVAGRDFSFSVNATTTIYGIRRFSGAAQCAVRHKMIPSVGFQYKPDFSDLSWGFYRQVRNPVTGSVITYSRFEDGIAGGPSAGLQQAINFNLQNIIEMKYIPQTQRNDTGKKQFKYVNLLDNIGFSGNYNFAADSFRLSVITATFRTNILNKLNITANANFDPYTLNAAGQRINKYQLDEDRSPARMTLFNLSIGTSLSAPTHKTTVITSPSSIVRNPDYEQIMSYRDQYIDFKIPWSVNINYNFVYTRPGLAISRIQSVSVSGELRLTEKWRINGTTGYDLVVRKPTFTTFSILRDLHCWELFFTAVPFGFRQSYQLEIRVKSPTLRDLKLQKRRDWQDRFGNAF